MEVSLENAKSVRGEFATTRRKVVRSEDNATHDQSVNTAQLSTAATKYLRYTSIFCLQSIIELGFIRITSDLVITKTHEPRILKLLPF